MRRNQVLVSGFAATLAMIAAAVLPAGVGQAQQSDRMQVPAAEATIYRDANFRGPAVFIGQANANLGLAWPVNSIRVAGGSWELCERINWGGTCRVVDRDQKLLGSLQRGMTVQSVRLVSGSSGGGFIGVEARNQVTRGASTEYHTQPESRGYRIPACPTGQPTNSCVKRTADNYCRTRGWRSSAHRMNQAIGQRAFLADVLCTNSN